MDIERLAAVPAAVDEDAVMAEMVEWLDGGRQQTQRPGWALRESWRITNVGQADWAMRKVGEVREREQEYDDQIKLWQEAKRRMAAAADWLEDRLAEWAIERRTDRIKSQQLAHGTVATSKHQPRIEVVDEAAVIEWARSDCPGAIRTVERFLKSEVGEAWRIGQVLVGWEATDKATGEIEKVPVDVPVAFDEDDLTDLQARMPGHSVHAVTELGVVDQDGYVVPGVVVEPERVTASIRPLFGPRRSP
jgi:hypothetical protein